MSVFSPSVRMRGGIRKTRRLTSALSHHSVSWRIKKDGVTVGRKKNLPSLCVLQSSSYHPPGLFHSDFPSTGPAFQRGHGLLVQADWTSQCCELEWHSVMDDLPHADLPETLAHRCRLFFLWLKFTLHWTKTSSFSLSLPHSRGLFIATLKEVRVPPCFRIPQGPLYVRTAKALRDSNMSG